MSLSRDGKRRLLADLLRMRLDITALGSAPRLQSMNCRCVPIDLSPLCGKGSEHRNTMAADWRFARAETRRIIGRMMQA